jgi:DNA-directed RNA polymerase subunit RPC12/RpoP
VDYSKYINLLNLYHSNMKCANCGWNFYQSNPEVCPCCRSKDIVTEEQLIERHLKTEQYEDAALLYEELEMPDKAEECRKKANPNYISPPSPMGKISSITIECPHCKTTQSLTSKKNEVTCAHCNKKYAIPKKIFELL